MLQFLSSTSAVYYPLRSPQLTFTHESCKFRVKCTVNYLVFQAFWGPRELSSNPSHWAIYPSFSVFSFQEHFLNNPFRANGTWINKWGFCNASTTILGCSPDLPSVSGAPRAVKTAIKEVASYESAIRPSHLQHLAYNYPEPLTSDGVLVLQRVHTFFDNPPFRRQSWIPSLWMWTILSDLLVMNRIWWMMEPSENRSQALWLAPSSLELLTPGEARGHKDTYEALWREAHAWGGVSSPACSHVSEPYSEQNRQPWSSLQMTAAHWCQPLNCKPRRDPVS